MVVRANLQLKKPKQNMCINEFNSDCRSVPRLLTWRSAVTAAVVLGSASIAAAGPPAATQPREAGVWYDDTGKGAVQIFDCGGKLCGRIFWLKEPLGSDGKPLFDGYNPDPKLRTRPICGLQVLGELTRQSDGTLDGGWVYDPKVGKSYDAAIEIAGANLILTGYKGIRLLSKSFTWTKAPPTLPKCNSPATAAR